MAHDRAERIEAEQRWTAIVVIVLGVLGFWVLARNLGTGDVEAADARAQFRAFAEAMADGDGDTACEMMRPDIAESFATRAALNLGVDRGSCPELVAALAARRPEDRSTELRGVAIIEVRMVGGDDATAMPPERAEIDIGTGTVVLERETGCAGSPECWTASDGGPVFRIADPTRQG